jgi:hypothetical protein
MIDHTAQTIASARLWLETNAWYKREVQPRLAGSSPVAEARVHHSDDEKLMGEYIAIATTFAEALVALSRPNKIDAARVDRGDYVRMSHLTICEPCGRTHGEHAIVPGFEWLHRLCDGRFVKL